METSKRQTSVAYGWLVGRRSICGRRLSYGLWTVRTLSVTWTEPLQLRYAACGDIQVLYAYASVVTYFGL